MKEIIESKFYSGVYL